MRTLIWAVPGDHLRISKGENQPNSRVLQRRERVTARTATQDSRDQGTSAMRKERATNPRSDGRSPAERGLLRLSCDSAHMSAETPTASEDAECKGDLKLKSFFLM